ncbi:hypothetical protein R69927_06711 [Paraburkholderia domus]|uniref:glycosyltransferase n=1 Tax=Paraburkholderia domus TaxID=2793075 RepID=UPI001914A914|nr:glycosyltransferase [Paraburkholderia domus]MBK5090856.1 glycosyltransferase [Burkholderia sp. R-69927]CAE6923669.1 hypothetical protein R69927_06711 [Paraburkholderia domus]
MKVEAVIRDTQWFAEADNSQPDVSVLLYVEGNGTSELARAVESVLAQTLKTIQLIVIDDTRDAEVSTWLASAQKRDPRLAVLRRSTIAGIPAIGWIEALKRARASLYVLAKESDRFHREALKQMLQEAQRSPEFICFGYVDIVEHDESGAVRTVKRDKERGKSMVELRVQNFIARNAILIPRYAIEAIGFVDPHVMLSQVAEWDLWRRLSESFEMKVVDVAVGICDASTIRAEAAGVDLWAVEEWMRTCRNDRLLLELIDNYELDAPDPTHGKATREVCVDLTRNQLGERRIGEVEEVVGANDDMDGYLLIVNVAYDASTTLYFDLLPPPFNHRVRVVTQGQNLPLEALARATAIIVSRAVRPYEAYLDVARQLGIPTYYFLDDNLPMLVETGELKISGEDFHLEALRENLKVFDGVLLSSVPLVEYFRQHNMHPRLLHYPVVCAAPELVRSKIAVQRKPKIPGEIVFAFMGGLHRSKAVWDVILPALAQIATSGQQIHFIAPGMLSDSKMLSDLPTSMRVTLLPWDLGYAFALRRFAQMSPDYVLLAPSKTRNNEYKTRHPLLTAHFVDAVAVLPKIEPYLDIVDGSVALIVDEPFEREGWHKVLRGIVDGHVDATAIKDRNRAFCATTFSGEQNFAVLREIVNSAGGAPSWPSQMRRLGKLGAGRPLPTTSPLGGDDSWLRSIEELHALRHMRRYSWRHRVFVRPSDLWEHCGPAFWAVQKDSLKYGWRRPGSTLEFSDSLHRKPAHDYRVALPECTLGGISFALAVDGPTEGKIVVELISPSGELTARASRELGHLDLTQPVRFTFGPLGIAGGAGWLIRLRCRSSMPVYVYEFINRRRFGTSYAPPTPFAELIMSDSEQRSEPGSLLQASPDVLQNTDASTFIDIKFVIEGDIPTNQIIRRLVSEAIGTRGRVEALLLSEFTPDVLFDGGIVILSRTASPASMPMIDWMKAAGVPFVYYIDDNFWELTGDTPLAQFYQCAPVRQTLDRSITEAKTVIVNAPRLGKYITDRYPGTHISYLNAPFDFSLLEGLPTAEEHPNEIRIGFAGSITRADDFVEILPALTRIRDKYSHVTLTFFGYCPPELANSERVTHVQQVANYEEFIKLKASYALDIGLAPMAASAANLYKTNNKYREYGALGIAGIYTNTSPYLESVVDGETGLLVSHTVEGWYEALERLVVDNELRRRIAKAAQEDVKHNYAQSEVANQWRKFLLDFAREYSTTLPPSNVRSAAAVRIQMRRWLSQTKIRAWVRVGRVRTLAAGLVRRMNGSQGG